MATASSSGSRSSAGSSTGRPSSSSAATHSSASVDTTTSFTSPKPSSSSAMAVSSAPQSSSIRSSSSSRISSRSPSASLLLESPTPKDTQLSSVSSESPTTSLTAQLTASSSHNRVRIDIGAVVGSAGGALLLGGILLVLLLRRRRRDKRRPKLDPGQFLMRERSIEPDDDQSHKLYHSGRGWPATPVTPTPASGWRGSTVANYTPPTTAGSENSARIGSGAAMGKMPHYTVRGHSFIGPSPSRVNSAANLAPAGFDTDIAWQQAHYEETLPIPAPAPALAPAIGVVPPTPIQVAVDSQPHPSDAFGGLETNPNPNPNPNRNSTASSISSVYSTASASAANAAQKHGPGQRGVQSTSGYAYSGEDDEDLEPYPHVPPGFSPARSSHAQPLPLTPEPGPNVNVSDRRTLDRSPPADWAALPLP